MQQAAQLAPSGDRSGERSEDPHRRGRTKDERLPATNPCRGAVDAGADRAAKEFALLELLLRRQGEVLPRSLIASQVWDMYFDTDANVIEVAVRRLRAMVDDDFESRLIRTVRGMGYVIEPPEQT
jgi:two-component system copper resistance phosphate regulon response regulator CusR